MGRRALGDPRVMRVEASGRLFREVASPHRAARLCQRSAFVSCDSSSLVL